MTLFGRQVSIRLLAALAAVVVVVVVFAVSATIVSSSRDRGDDDTSRSFVHQTNPKTDGGATDKTTTDEGDGTDFNDLVDSSGDGESSDSPSDATDGEPDNKSEGLGGKVQERPEDDSSFGDIQ